jgi:spore maturation protein CgeB
MKIIYSFNKHGFEAAYWSKELSQASGSEFSFIVFNHGSYMNPFRYIRAQLLDNLYFAENSHLMRMYRDLERMIEQTNADAIVVDNCPPYHPDYLRDLPIYKVLRTSDGPITAYDRDFAYVHAYDHVLYHSPAYSRDMTMAEKLQYCGAKRADFWPLASFDALCDPCKTEQTIMQKDRDVDIVFVGALHVNKMPLIAKIKRTFRSRCHIYGKAVTKKNLYFNLKYGFPGWIRELDFESYVPLYQRAKIGFNVHNRGKFTVGGYRLFCFFDCICLNLLELVGIVILYVLWMAK